VFNPNTKQSFSVSSGNTTDDSPLRRSEKKMLTLSKEMRVLYLENYAKFKNML
jgi:hypothetical protein